MKLSVLVIFITLASAGKCRKHRYGSPAKQAPAQQNPVTQVPAEPTPVQQKPAKPAKPAPVQQKSTKPTSVPAPAPKKDESKPKVVSNSVTDQLVEGLNNFRAKQGLRKVSANNLLNKAAESSCQNHMGKRGSLNHNAGGSPGQRARGAGYNFRSVGENLYSSSGSPTASDATNAWIKSPGHRANMVGDFTEVGHAVCNGYDGFTYFVEVFGKQ